MITGMIERKRNRTEAELTNAAFGLLSPNSAQNGLRGFEDRGWGAVGLRFHVRGDARFVGVHGAPL